MKIDSIVTDHLLTTTRAVRRRMDFDKSVDISVIDDCIEIAMQAPWGEKPVTAPHCVAIIDPDLRKTVGEHYRELNEPYCKRGHSCWPSGPEASGHA